MSNKVEPKILAELEAMHTGSLMSHRKALLKCDESFELSDKTACSSSGLIEFTDTPEWKQDYHQLKEVLADRKHVPNKLACKKPRPPQSQEVKVK